MAKTEGWDAVPSGTRTSTYQIPAFRQANAHAAVELEAIQTADPNDATLPKSPYTGIQFATIPEFPGLGNAVGQLIASLLDGNNKVGPVLARAQALAEQRMRSAAVNAAGSAPTPAPAPARDRKSTRLNSSHSQQSRMPSSA